jgi:dolichol-phosphate mannosyltransferase
MLTIVIPTYDEADNIAPLIAEIEAALAGSQYEIIFIDDSGDRTVEVIKHLWRLWRIGAEDERIWDVVAGL